MPDNRRRERQRHFAGAADRGETGIGKSRLVQTLKDQIGQERATRIEFRCSPHYHHSAFYPIIEHVQRLLQFHREDSPQAKLTKLQQTLVAYRFPQADTVALLAALLSLSHSVGASPIALSPQKQTQKTQVALIAWLVEEAEHTLIWRDQAAPPRSSPLPGCVPSSAYLSTSRLRWGRPRIRPRTR